jgi:hypothetical protein
VSFVFGVTTNDRELHLYLRPLGAGLICCRRPKPWAESDVRGRPIFCQDRQCVYDERRGRPRIVAARVVVEAEVSRLGSAVSHEGPVLPRMTERRGP